MSDPRDKKSICSDCSNELSACHCKPPIQCFAWQDNDPRFGIYLYSISATKEGVRTKLLIESMGWRYEYGGHEEEWQRLLTIGRIVPVTVSLTQPATPKEETEDMIAELREAGGSDLDNVIEPSEATDGTAIGKE